MLIVYGLVGVNVMVTLFSAIGIERLSNRISFVLFHVYWDFVFVSVLIFVSGGFHSLYSFIYIFTVIFTAILATPLHTIIISLSCSLLYSLILLGQHFHILSPLSTPGNEFAELSLGEVIVKLLLNSLAFIISGILASYLSNLGKAADAKIRQQQLAMEELKVLNENIVQSLPVGLITCDSSDRVTFANAHAGPLLGRGKQSLRGALLSDLLPNLWQNDKSPMEVTLEPEDPNENKRTLAVTVAALRDSVGDIIGRVVSLQDVTTIRELEEIAKRADRQAVVGKLAAGIAHEIRNPLASVSGSIQVLRSELELDTVHGSLMDIVLRETDRLNKLVTDFLVYARPSKKSETVADLSTLLEEQLDVLANDPAYQDRIRIKADLEKGLVCRFDRDQLRQLFWNLLINGMQAMTKGEGTLTIASHMSERHPDNIEVEISDTGPGIDPEVLKSIFDPFFTTKENGTGLGLNIAYQIAENHDGKILVDSVPGKGTTFHVLLPV